jgi:metallo-beta-lactamase family protein
MNINFFGAAKEVTGSKHLITLNSGKKVLLDCGFFQGRGSESSKRNRHFDFNPEEVDYLILSHAHIDHSGNIPLLVKSGFRGKIYCTPATLDLCKIMLADSAHIQMYDVKFINKRRASRGMEPIEPLYDKADVELALNHFVPIPYLEKFSIDNEVTVQFTDAGHILGAAAVNLTITENNKEKKLTFTGDVGRYINKILKKPQPFPQADYIICESTYGDRLHESINAAKENLQKAVHETCVVKKGKLIIPAFSIGKTQEMVFTLNKLEFEGKLPKVPVFVDSPLAINATEIMRDHPECFGRATLKFMKKDPDPFGFQSLSYVREAEDSKKLNSLKGPAIIISASGMADAGRVKHHLANSLENEKNSVLIIGYSEPSSLSGRLLRGDKIVTIFGKETNVKADIFNIDFFSAHADYGELLQFLSCQDPAKVKNVFLVHGNPSALENFRDNLREKNFYDVTIAERKKTYDI